LLQAPKDKGQQECQTRQEQHHGGNGDDQHAGPGILPAEEGENDSAHAGGDAGGAVDDKPGSVRWDRPRHAEAGIGMALGFEDDHGEDEQIGSKSESGAAEEIEIRSNAQEQQAELEEEEQAEQQGQGGIKNVLGFGEVVFRQEFSENENSAISAA
jgi:hypothetical protein